MALYLSHDFQQSDFIRFFLDPSADETKANAQIIFDLQLVDAANPSVIVDYDVSANRLYLVRGKASWADIRAALKAKMYALRQSLIDA